MRSRYILFLVLTILCWASSLTLADAPNRMNFQGRLTDPAGNPLTGSYDIAFSIWTAASLGTELWDETLTAVSVNNGLFNVELGSSDAIDDSVLFQTETRYLEIQVLPDPPLSSRQRLASAPYAFSLENEAGVAEVNAVGSCFALDTAEADIISRSISVQTDGYIIAIASGYSFISLSATTDDQYARATISTTSGVMDFENLATYGAADWAGTSANFSSFGITRLYSVGPGTHSYYLVADKFSATGDVQLCRPRMVLLFVPEAKGGITGLFTEGNSDMSTAIDPSRPDYGSSNSPTSTVKPAKTEGQEQ